MCVRPPTGLIIGLLYARDVRRAIDYRVSGGNAEENERPWLLRQSDYRTIGLHEAIRGAARCDEGIRALCRRISLPSNLVGRGYHPLSTVSIGAQRFLRADENHALAVGTPNTIAPGKNRRFLAWILT